MSAEQVLLVEDNPINLRLTQVLLLQEGYTIRTAGDAEEALSILADYRPNLMLIDIQLPGMDGLELTRRVKSDPANRDIVIVALTAYAMRGDEQLALESGCDGYITKPIDTRKLPLRLREYLSKRAPQTPSAPPRGFAAGDSEIEALRRRFLAEGLERSQELLACLPFALEPESARRTAHQWIGAAGLFGYTRISELARETELALKEQPLDNAQVRESLTALLYAFSDAPHGLHIDVPAKVRETLSGRRIALAGFTDAIADRLSASLASAHAHPFRLSAADGPDSPTYADADLIMVCVRDETMNTPWLRVPGAGGAKPLILVGDPENLTALDGAIRDGASGLLIDPWHLEEAWMRAFLTLSCRKPPRRVADAPKAFVRPARRTVLLADPDATVLNRLQAALADDGVDAITATCESDVLASIRSDVFDAVVIDLQMATEGLDLLSRLRALDPLLHIILLASRGQEEVLRAFANGADDYIVKPFSPAALLARQEGPPRFACGDSNEAMTGHGCRPVNRSLSDLAPLANCYVA